MGNIKENSYIDVIARLEAIEGALSEIRIEIQTIRAMASPEVCPDENEANSAAYEAIREICLDSLFDVEPMGDA
jgi:hypothetical protein